MSDTAFHEYPKCLTHPDLPAVIAATAEAEEKYLAQGYTAPGKSDPAAFEEARSGAPGGYRPAEYPKWVNGVLVNDAKGERAALTGKLKPADPYPLEITVGNGQRITVKDRADHERICGPLDTPAPPKPDMPSATEWAEFKAAKAAGAIPANGEAA